MSFGGFEVFCEFAVKVVKRISPLNLALFHRVKGLFHSRRVSLVKEIVKACYEKVVDRGAERSRIKAALKLLDIFAIDNRRHDRRVSRRSANSLLFKSFNESRLGVSRWWLRKMLFRIYRIKTKNFSLFHSRQRAFSFVIFLGFFVAALLIKLEKAVKFQNRACCTEAQTSRTNVDRGLIKQRRHHL